jgi:hypothetical protein
MFSDDCCRATLTEHRDLVEALAVPYRSTDAYTALLRLGVNALPAVRAGLRHVSCRFLDRYLFPDMLSDLMDMLNDSDARVRCSALHSLACDRCKEGTCGPQEARVLPQAMELPASDPDPHVRAMAIELVGQFVHSNPLAADALVAAVRTDECSAVRKKAGWYAPGGSIYRPPVQGFARPHLLRTASSPRQCSTGAPRAAARSVAGPETTMPYSLPRPPRPMRNGT